MDQFGNILKDYTQKANDTYASNTASANAAQQKADEAYNAVNQQAQQANENAAKLSSLGDQYSNVQNATDLYRQDQQEQLGLMGFDKTTLNQANQNIAQAVGQYGTANNQIAEQGGSRGINAIGVANRQANVQNQTNAAINANAQVQSNELGQAGAAATFTGQQIGAQQNAQQMGINAYNSAASSYNNSMANYATVLATMANQATTYGGLVGSNVAQLMSAGNAAAQIALTPYQAQLLSAQSETARASATASYASANLSNAQAALTTQQKQYNDQLMPLQIQAQKDVLKTNDQINDQINVLTKQINNESADVGFLDFVAGIVGLDGPSEAARKKRIQSEREQIRTLQGSLSR